MKHLQLAPHRLYFFLGAITVALLFTWWWLALQNGTELPVHLHALLMPLGVFPLFILGFTFTAGPRWLAVKASDRYFLMNGCTYFFGLLLVLFGSRPSFYPLRISGFILMLSAWCIVSVRWASLIRLSRANDRKHALAILCAMTGGILSLLFALLWACGWTRAWEIARHLSFSLFLLPIFLTVCHRMLPFFSGNVIPSYTVWRPYPLLFFWIAMNVAIMFSQLFHFADLEGILATVLACSFAWTSWRWGLHRSLGNRLLAMLHLSFAWLSIVFALQAANALGLNLGSASTHALALGFMGTMLVGFVSRVSFGHSNRPLHASNLLWALYLGLHGAALLRVIASVLAMPDLMQLSATLWLVLLITWVALMLPIYWNRDLVTAPA